MFYVFTNFFDNPRFFVMFGAINIDDLCKLLIKSSSFIRLVNFLVRSLHVSLGLGPRWNQRVAYTQTKV